MGHQMRKRAGIRAFLPFPHHCLLSPLFLPDTSSFWKITLSFEQQITGRVKQNKQSSIQLPYSNAS